MKLLPEELKDKLPSIEKAKKEEDPTVVAKYFHPMSDWTWYAAGYSDGIFWGLVDGHYLETGLFSLKEMEEVKVLGLGIERDLYFKPIKMSEIKAKIQERRR